LLGWVDVHELPALCRECDLGVCVDAMQYETLFGVRLRILAMLAAGLPVACALGSEISHILQEEEIGLVFPAGSAEDFADAIVRASQRPTEIRALGQRGRNHATRYFTVAEQTRAFAEWVDRPALAPDNAEKARRAGGLELFQDVALNAIQETFARLGGDDIRDLVQAKIDVDAIRAKWWYDLGRRAKRSSLAALRKARIVRPQ